jgi:outer membrane protein
MRIRGLSTLVASAFAATALANAAEDPTKPSLAYARPSPSLQGKIDLSLRDALSLGLENNLVIAIQRHTPLISHQDYRTAWGTYDPTFDAEFGYADNENPTSNQLAGGTPGNLFVLEETVLDGFGSIGGLVPWLGASYDLTFGASDTRSNSAIAGFSPDLRSSFSVGLTLPLLRGLIWNEPWTLVQTSRIQEESDWEQFRVDVMDTVLLIEQTYWQLIADEESVRVGEKSVQTAQALLDQVTTQYEVGVVSKVEIAEAEAGLAQRDFDLIVAQNTYGDTMDELINLTLGPNLEGGSQIHLNPTDRSDAYIAYEIDTEEATQIAFANRPELAVVRKQIEQLKIRLKFAKNQRLPRVDAQVGYGNRGLAGFTNPDGGGLGGAPPASIGGFGKTFETPGDWFTSNAARQLSARALISIPFPNTAGRAGVSRSKLELRRAEILRRQEEQRIILDVRSRARALKSAQEGIRAADRARVAAAEQLRAERIRLEYGESTPFDVLLREQDLVTAEQRYIDAFRVYRQAVTGLDRAQGTLLRNRNIQIEQAARLR